MESLRAMRSVTVVMKTWLSVGRLILAVIPTALSDQELFAGTKIAKINNTTIIVWLYHPIMDSVCYC